MTRDQLLSLFFIALLLFIIYQIIGIFAPFMKAIFWAAILAFGFYPIYASVRRRLHSRDTLAAFLMTIVIFMIVVPPVVVIIVNVTGQAIELYQWSVDYVREGRFSQLIDDVRAVPWIQTLEERLVTWEPLTKNVESWILTSSKAVGTFAAAQVGTVTKNIFFVVLNVFLILILLFIFLKDGHKIYRFLYDITPLEEENKKAIFGQINDTFSAVIRGQLLTCLTQALVAGVIYWLLGLPVPILFATATFITALIPVIGAAGVWVPLAIYLAVTHHFIKAIILSLFGLLVISLIDNIMKPAIIGEKTKLPYFLLFFGILGGIKLYGIMGIFLAPVVLSSFFALVKIYQEKFL